MNKTEIMTTEKHPSKEWVDEYFRAKKKLKWSKKHLRRDNHIVRKPSFVRGTKILTPMKGICMVKISGMTEFICLKCCRVFQAGESYAKCCGEIEIFNPEKHAEYIIGNSNAWIDVWKKWKDNKIFNEISDELIQDGCYGASHHINAFIQRLLDDCEKQEWN